MGIQNHKSIIQKTKRLVLKIGSSVLVDSKGNLSPNAFQELGNAIREIQKKKVLVTVVSSGAILCGMQILSLKTKPKKIPELQACAALGQADLIQRYQEACRTLSPVAQVLLTRSDLEHRTRFLNAKHTLNELLHRGILPIINENDTVTVDEIRVGDNDNLAAFVTNVVDADFLILLTDQDGLYTSDPKKDSNAKKIPLVENIDDQTRSAASGAGASFSVGGMKTKVEAARIAAQFGVPTLIANGREPQVLQKIFQGEPHGTLFLPRVDKLTARKHWIAHTLKPQGKLIVDKGAEAALIDGKKSLLPSGILSLEGKFRSGDAVNIATEKGAFAQGLVAYDSTEISKIIGKKSSEIKNILGYEGPDEIIHRNDLVLL